MACTNPAARLRVQLRGGSCVPRRARAAPVAPRRPLASAASPPAAAAPRRALLAAGAAALTAALALPQRALANPLDDLLAAKRKTNAKFLVGPIVLARLRLRDAQALPVEQARKAVNAAALDCLVIDSGNLQLYSNYREVCTFRIVARSVTQGPAAKHAPDSPTGAETIAAVKAVVAGFRTLDDALAAGGADAPAAYGALGSALDRFQAAVLAALEVTPEQVA